MSFPKNHSTKFIAKWMRQLNWAGGSAEKGHHDLCAAYFKLTWDGPEVADEEVAFRLKVMRGVAFGFDEALLKILLSRGQYALWVPVEDDQKEAPKEAEDDDE